MKTFKENLSIFLLGGGLYYIIEIFYKGIHHGVWHSHWTMFLLGGAMTLVIGLLNNTIFDWDTPLYIQSIIGGTLITSFEYLVGYIVNIHLGLNIWDYSDLPCNINGQVCLEFSIIWCLLSIVVVFFDDYIRYLIFNEEKPHYKLK